MIPPNPEFMPDFSRYRRPVADLDAPAQSQHVFCAHQNFDDYNEFLRCMQYFDGYTNFEMACAYDRTIVVDALYKSVRVASSSTAALIGSRANLQGV